MIRATAKRHPRDLAPWRSRSRGACGASVRLAPTAPKIALIQIALITAACEPLDHPPTSSGDLPMRAITYLDPERVSTFRLEEGVVYRFVRGRSEPWSIHLLEVDARRCELGFRVVRAEDSEGRIEVTEMARRAEPGVIAAINGDFFTPEDLPLGPEVAEGRFRGGVPRPVFAWRPGERPWVGPVEWAGDSLYLGGWTVSEEGPAHSVQIVAGFPALLHAGEQVGDLGLSERPAFSAERHPRTAVGLDSRRGRLWLIVAEGRRGGVSEGMSLPELADLFIELGVTDAINLDGGSSSVMVIREEAVSRPSNPAGERAVVNGLIVRRDEAYCAARPAERPFPARGGP